MTDTVSHRMAPEERPLQPFRQQAHAWLSASTGLAHWWSPDAAVRDEAIQALLAQANTLVPARRTCVFQEGDFLALLQRLNGLLAAAQSGQSQARAHAGQLWVLDRAERVSAEHIDILRRICLHYPELQIHLALFSQTAQAPLSADGVQVHALAPSLRARVLGGGMGAGRSAGVPVRRWWVGGLLCAVAVMSGLLVWRSGQDAAPASARDLAAVPKAAEGAAPKAQDLPLPGVSTPRPAAAEGGPVRTAQAPTSTKDGAQSASRRWALGLPPSSLAVVHAQVTSLREAEVFRASKPLLANARILQTSAEGAPVRFLVVTGPFRSQERAQNYMRRLEWKSDARSIGREELLTLVVR